MMSIEKIKEYGAKEFDVEDAESLDIIRELVRLGWAVYPESFDDENLECHNYRYKDRQEDSWILSGSKSTLLSVVYDPKRWVIRQSDCE